MSRLETRFNAHIESAAKFINESSIEKYKDLTIIHGIGTQRQSKGLPTMRIFIGKSTKPNANYYYNSIEKMESSLNEYKSRANSREEYKNEKKAKKASFNPTSKVGDIFCNSWGYDQTNIDYYQIIEKPSTHYAIVRQINSKIIDTTRSGDYVVSPNKGSFSERYPKEIRVKIKNGYNGSEAFRVNSYSNAYSCSENETNHETGPYNGH
jgi:hypothetical protein